MTYVCFYLGSSDASTTTINVVHSGEHRLGVTLVASAIPADRYIRLTESRSVTPSPPPPPSLSSSNVTSLALGYGMVATNSNNTPLPHIPSLSPISGSPEATTPTSESPPPIKLKTISSTAHIISPTSKAKAALNSKISSLTMFLNSKAQAKRLALKLQ